MEKAALALGEEMRAIQENATTTLRRLEKNTKEHERVLGEKQGVISAQADHIAHLEHTLEEKVTDFEHAKTSLATEQASEMEAAVANATMQLKRSEADAVNAAVESAQQTLSQVWEQKISVQESRVIELEAEVASAHTRREVEVAGIGEKVELLQEAHIAQVSQMKEEIVRVMKAQMEIKVNELTASHGEALRTAKDDAEVGRRALEAAHAAQTLQMKEETAGAVNAQKEKEISALEEAHQVALQMVREEAEVSAKAVEAQAVETTGKERQTMLNQLSEAMKESATVLRAAEDSAATFKSHAKAEIAACKATHEEMTRAFAQDKAKFLQDMQAGETAHAAALQEALAAEKKKYDALCADMKRASEVEKRTSMEEIQTNHSATLVSVETKVEERVRAATTASLTASFEENIVSRLQEQKTALAATAANELRAALQSVSAKATEDRARSLERIEEAERDRDAKIAECRASLEDKLRAVDLKAEERLKRQQEALQRKLDEAVAAAVHQAKQSGEEETQREVASKERELREAMQVMQVTYHGEAASANEAAVKAALDTAQAQAEADYVERLEQVLERERASHALERDAAVENAIETTKRKGSAARLALEREFADAREALMAEASSATEGASVAIEEQSARHAAAIDRMKERHAEETTLAVAQAIDVAVRQEREAHGAAEKRMKEDHAEKSRAAVEDAVKLAV